MTRDITLSSLAAILSAIFLAPIIVAAPYITPEQWDNIQPSPSQRIFLPAVDYALIRAKCQTLTDEGYAYLAEYIQICDFLAAWQVPDTASPNYGGMIEGESGGLANIIQTDNTQEAIRVWSRYARITGDSDRYQANIAAAWTYTLNFPAYSEEGETDYYRVHNCGWGLVAQMEYFDVYEDTAYIEYADSCAEYVVNHPLSFTQGAPFYQQLHPLVTGWAAGALYQYGQYVSNQTYIDTALVFGERVKEWIETDPNRLANNELWAMSGGTAMWGVIESVFQEDSLAGTAWLEQYLPFMDVYAGPGEWNNSWNIWYSHAHRAAYDLLGDSLYQYYAVFLVDTLLIQDTDNDGGIPAGSADPDTMDQTWVSCYTDYMGIEKIISTLPQYDAGIIAFHQPQAGVPIEFPAEVEIAVLAVNFGSQILEEVSVSAQISPDYTGAGTASLLAAGIDTVNLSPLWLPPDTGYYTISSYTTLPGDMNTANDTLSIQVEIRGSGTLSGALTDAGTGEGLDCQLNLYHQEVSDFIPYAQTSTQMPAGVYSLELMAGEYRIEVHPQIPYNIIDFFPVAVIAGQSNEFDMNLTPAPLLLVDDDGIGWYEEYLIEPLQNLGLEHYYWEYAESGALSGRAALFPFCVWITGKESTGTLLDTDKDELADFLQSGGNLLLTGQNIGDDLGTGDPFMNEFLKADHQFDNVNQFLLDGEDGHPISNSTSLFLIGSPGAGNQNSPASCLPLTGGEPVYNYQNPPYPIGAVSCESPEYGYKSIYFSFGVEAISGLMNTTNLQGLFYSIFQWWEFPTEVALEKPDIVPAFRLHPPYPNPCNPAARITYTVPSPGFTELAVYNLLGQRVDLLWSGYQPPGEYTYIWNSASHSGNTTSSGVYYCRLSYQGGARVQPLILLK